MLLVQRWILARLRHHRFFALDELNRHIATLLEDLNHRPFKRRPGSRRSAFETLDKPALQPLPPHPYEYVHIKPVTVHVDYHVQYQQHCYSVPHQFVGEKLELHASNTLIELYFHQRCIATHARRHDHGFSTLPAHMPERHLNAACRRANQAGLVRLKQVKHLLESNQDRLPDTPDADTPSTTPLPQHHENVRGPHHFN